MLHVVKAIMRNAKAVLVGVTIMDKEKKRDSLEEHTIKKSACEMDEKLNAAGKKLKERY